jgi:hypothetical protein
VKPWYLAAAVPLWLVGPTVAGQPVPAFDVLRRPGETTVFSFVTSHGKTVSLCEGPRGKYLVYRFGTAAKLELQYPRVLDGSSWQKFTYDEYHRGGGAHNAGRDTHRLSFSVGSIDYVLMDETLDLYNRKHEEVERRTTDIWVYGKEKATRITGRAYTASQYLELDDAQRKKVKAPDDEN